MTIDEYILQHIDDEGDYLKALYRDTHVKLLYPRMASGHLQGRMPDSYKHLTLTTSDLCGSLAVGGSLTMKYVRRQLLKTRLSG